MEEEIWKDINGYEGIYQVSNMGRVRSLNRIITYIRENRKISKLQKGCIIKLATSTTGYLFTHLDKKRSIKYYRINRLVAEHFLLNPNNYPMVNHKNEIKTDNRVDNLEWCTHKYNVNYGTGIERSRSAKIGKPRPDIAGSLNCASKLTDQDVIDIYNDKNTSLKTLAIKYGVSIHPIWMIRTRRTWKHITNNL